MHKIFYDSVLLSGSKETMIKMLQDLHTSCEKTEMKINKKKPKCVVLGRRKERLDGRLRKYSSKQILSIFEVLFQTLG